MKIVHLIGCGFGSGAGKAVETLHDHYLAKGMDSHVLGRVEADLTAEKCATRYSFLDRALPVIGRKLTRAYTKRILAGNSDEILLLPIFGGNPDKYDAYKTADIIHIQWIGSDTFSKRFWKILAKETRPVIWTLRDMWIMTGGCGFSADCQGYESGCQLCPLLKPTTSIAKENFAFKAEHIPETTTFISISNHFKTIADKSAIIHQRDHRVIYNSVAPPPNLLSQDQARSKLNLDKDAVFVGSGALNLNEERKGAKTLKYLSDNFKDSDVCTWLLFGQNLSQLLGDIPENISELGLIRSAERLGNIYASCDVFAMPSLQESFGKVTAEAMLCGTPVIAYDNTPAEDMIIHGETGWLVPHGDHETFANVLSDALALGSEKLTQIGKAARISAEEKFSLDSICEQYTELYREKLGLVPKA